MWPYFGRYGTGPLFLNSNCKVICKLFCCLYLSLVFCYQWFCQESDFFFYCNNLCIGNITDSSDTHTKRKKHLKYFTLYVMNLYNIWVSLFELNYWNKLTFPWYSNVFRCTCMCSTFFITHWLHTSGTAISILLKDTSAWKTGIQRPYHWSEDNSLYLLNHSCIIHFQWMWSYSHG